MLLMLLTLHSQTVCTRFYNDISLYPIQQAWRRWALLQNYYLNEHDVLVNRHWIQTLIFFWLFHIHVRSDQFFMTYVLTFATSWTIRGNDINLNVRTAYLLYITRYPPAGSFTGKQQLEADYCLQRAEQLRYLQIPTQHVLRWRRWKVVTSIHTTV
jgi:hypothetical protein